MEPISLQFKSDDLIGLQASDYNITYEMEAPVCASWKPSIPDFFPGELSKLQIPEAVFALAQVSEDNLLDDLDKKPTISTMTFLDLNEVTLHNKSKQS